MLAFCIDGFVSGPPGISLLGEIARSLRLQFHQYDLMREYRARTESEVRILWINRALRRNSGFASLRFASTPAWPGPLMIPCMGSVLGALLRGTWRSRTLVRRGLRSCRCSARTSIRSPDMMAVHFATVFIALSHSVQGRSVRVSLGVPHFLQSTGGYLRRWQSHCPAHRRDHSARRDACIESPTQGFIESLRAEEC